MWLVSGQPSSLHARDQDFCFRLTAGVRVVLLFSGTRVVLVLLLASTSSTGFCKRGSCDFNFQFSQRFVTDEGTRPEDLSRAEAHALFPESTDEGNVMAMASQEGSFLQMRAAAFLALLTLVSAATFQSLNFQSARCDGSRTRTVLRLRGAGNDRSEGSGKDNSLHSPETVGLMSSQGLLARPSAFDQVGEATQGGSLGADGQAKMCDEDESSARESDGYVEISEEEFRKNQDLWEAVKKGDDLEIERLVQDGANLECCDPDFGDWTAMHYAAQAGRSRIVTCLIRLGADVDSVNERMSTPLSVAAAEGHISIVQKLVARGADVDAPNKWGITPLHRSLLLSLNSLPPCSSYLPPVRSVCMVRELQRSHLGIGLWDDIPRDQHVGFL